jgi:S1-C subfamily serine protease
MMGRWAHGQASVDQPSADQHSADQHSADQHSADQHSADQHSAAGKKLPSGASDSSFLKGRGELFARLKQSIVALEMTTLSGQRYGNGTGFVVREDGLVVTNEHVVKGEGALWAVFATCERFAVTGVVLRDEAHDLAVVDIEATGLSPLPLGDSSTLREGDRLFIGGSPLGLDFSFAEGTLAAIRAKGLPADFAEKPADSQALLQLDINSDHGGSGSPIVNEAGEVVGIERAGMGRSSFAVPVNTLRQLLTADRLARAPTPLRAFPWVNLAISVVILAATATLLTLKFRRARKTASPGIVRHSR